MLEVNTHSSNSTTARAPAGAAAGGAAGVFAALMSADQAGAETAPMPLQGLVPEAAKLAAQAQAQSAPDKSALPAAEQAATTPALPALDAANQHRAGETDAKLNQDLLSAPLPQAGEMSEGLALTDATAESELADSEAALPSAQIPADASTSPATDQDTALMSAELPVATNSLPQAQELAAAADLAAPMVMDDTAATVKELGKGAEAVATVLRSSDERPARPGQSISALVSHTQSANNASSAVAAASADPAELVAETVDSADFKLAEQMAMLAQKVAAPAASPAAINAQLNPGMDSPLAPGLLHAVAGAAPSPAPDISLAAMRPDTPVIASQFSEHVMAHIRQRGDDQFEARLALHPAELGDLSLQIEQDGQRLELKISVDNEQARRVIGEQLSQLRERLGELGMQLGEANVEVRQDAQRQESDTHSSTDERMMAEDVKEPSARPQIVSSNGLDLYA